MNKQQIKDKITELQKQLEEIEKKELFTQIRQNEYRRGKEDGAIAQKKEDLNDFIEWLEKTFPYLESLGNHYDYMNVKIKLKNLKEQRSNINSREQLEPIEMRKGEANVLVNRTPQEVCKSPPDTQSPQTQGDISSHRKRVDGSGQWDSAETADTLLCECGHSEFDHTSALGIVKVCRYYDFPHSTGRCECNKFKPKSKEDKA